MSRKSGLKFLSFSVISSKSGEQAYYRRTSRESPVKLIFEVFSSIFWVIFFAKNRCLICLIYCNCQICLSFRILSGFFITKSTKKHTVLEKKNKKLFSFFLRIRCEYFVLLAQHPAILDAFKICLNHNVFIGMKFSISFAVIVLCHREN